MYIPLIKSCDSPAPSTGYRYLGLNLCFRSRDWVDNVCCGRKSNTPVNYSQARIFCYCLSFDIRIKGFLHHPNLTKKSELITHILLLLIHEIELVKVRVPSTGYWYLGFTYYIHTLPNSRYQAETDLTGVQVISC